MKNSILVIFLTTFLAACSTAPSINKTHTNYNSQTEARMRLYGQNGSPSIASYEHNGKTIKINVGNNIGDAVGSLLGVKNSESIGMPETEISKSLGNRNGIASRAFFREIVIPANTQINIEVALLPLAHIDNNPGGLSFTKKGCSRKLSFIAKPNTDYDIASNQCNGIVYEIKTEKGTNNTTLIPVN